ncbi:peritrophin-1-like [Hyposmocoma kahamanoa]|uniref:peritrophin-1-like n=1 Tax=Hyposmocoma kahamanoa TaxID=1477025 RepID=UPI000E6D6657|nr:peritrophin-1-like [Hyposmocoma kahamanoa]
MIGKLVLVLLLVGTIKARSQSPIQSSRSHQEDFYNGPFFPNGCPVDPNVHWLLRHHTYCNKFFRCDSGQLDERSCAPGSLFNYFTRPGPVCDWQELVVCGNLIRPPLLAEPKSPGKMIPTGCPTDFSVHKLLPHETYCNKFYYCVFGEKVERDCAPGTYFNPDAYPGPVCDWPDKVDCSRRT